MLQTSGTEARSAEIRSESNTTDCAHWEEPKSGTFGLGLRAESREPHQLEVLETRPKMGVRPSDRRSPDDLEVGKYRLSHFFGKSPGRGHQAQGLCGGAS